MKRPLSTLQKEHKVRLALSRIKWNGGKPRRMPLFYTSIRSPRPPMNTQTSMDIALKASFLDRSAGLGYGFGSNKASLLTEFNRSRRISGRISTRTLSRLRFPSLPVQGCASWYFPGALSAQARSKNDAGEVFVVDQRVRIMGLPVRRGLGFVLVAIACGLFVVRCQSVLAAESVAGAGVGILRSGRTILSSLWPKLLQILQVFKEQGVVLAALLGLSAFFSMAETSITTLWPWKVRELAEKEPENGVFRMLSSDVTRFLTTILIGTTVVNIGATALVTEAATMIFGEAGVSAATGVMTVAILLLTEITPKSVAVHNATEVARFVVRPVAWLSLVLYPVGRVVTFLSMGMLKILGLKGRSEPYVTEDELKLMLRGAELSGAIEEEEQDMIENVLEIKDTHVREVMTPLVDVVAIDGSATLIDFQKLWETHQYSRVPVFEERIDNIVGIAYAMDMIEFVEKVEKLKEITVREIAHMPTYFVPDSMSVWNLLREFRIRQVHMAVVLNEYGGTVGIITLEDVVEEIVGEIFDESDSKEEIQKKTGYIVVREDGTFDVDANTSIDQLSEELNVKIPEGHQYETVSGFVCDSFGYIPQEGGKMIVVLEKANQEENNEYSDTTSDHQDEKEKHQTFELENWKSPLSGNSVVVDFDPLRGDALKFFKKIMEANARKVGKVHFKPIKSDFADLENEGMNRFVSTKVVRQKNLSGSEPEMSNHGDSETNTRSHGKMAEQPEHGFSNEVITVQETLKGSHGTAADKKVDDHDCNTQQ